MNIDDHFENSVPLQKYVDQSGGYSAAALQLGLTRSAVIQMIGNGRHIYVKKVGRQMKYAEVKDYARGFARAAG